MSMIQILRDNVEEIKELRLSGMKIRELADKYNVSYSTMWHFLTTRRIVLNAKPIEQSVINKILSDYIDGVSYETIAKDVHMDKESVRCIIENNHVLIRDKSHSHRKYKINEEYFDSIDNQNKAYILGLLYTDGAVVCINNHYCMRLKLQDRDMDILYKINNEIENERPLYFVNCSMLPNIRNQYEIIIDNKHIVESLQRWGIVQNKTCIIGFPDFLSDDLVRHFIRGCFDGDGTISHNPKEHSASITCNGPLVLGIKDYLEKKLNIHFSVIDPHCKSESIRCISCRGGKQVKKLLEYLYEDANLYLNRKYGYYLYMYGTHNKSFIA